MQKYSENGWDDGVNAGDDQHSSSDGYIRRHFDLCSSDLACGDDRSFDRLVVAAKVDRFGVFRSPVEAQVRLDRSSWFWSSSVVVCFYGALCVLPRP